ncbi:MAG: ATP-dependent Clp protease ATP-binding subunit [Candidatus Kerfeldbacteria bacterium]|nr:ATP-dependent Clp protease ATP-binding subunit [Candidatus Kerfeldbacteria bacterium]
MAVALSAAWIDCPQCHGFGYTITPAGKHVICSWCRAEQSVLGFIENDLVYWGEQLSVSSVLEKKLERTINWIVTTVFIVAASAGLIALLLEIIELQVTHQPLVHLFSQRSPLILGFWASVVADLFLYYRLVRSNQHRYITAENKLAHFTITGSATDWKYWRNVPDQKKIEASLYLHDTTTAALEQAYLLAERWHHTEVKPLHLLLTLYERSDIRALLYRLEIDNRELQRTLARLTNRLEKSAHPFTTPDLGAELRRALLLAYAEARDHHRPQVKPVEALVGCILADQLINDALYEREVTLDKVRSLVEWSNIVDDMLQQQQRRYHLGRSKPKTIMNRAMTARPTNQLDAVSQDFTLQARAGHFLPVIGRNQAVQEAFRVLQEGHSSVLFVGESGSGKTSLLQGIAQLMTAEDVPVSLQDKRFVVSEPGAIIAGAGGVGGIEQRMELIIRDIIMAGNVIWGIEDIHTLLGAGSTGSNIDIGKILMNYISQGYIKVVGTTTTPEFQKYIENNETFLRRFQVVTVAELAPADAVRVLASRALYVESKQKVYFTHDALVAAVELTERFMKDRHLPAKALDIMEEAAIYAREQLGEHALVSKAVVERIMSEKTNVQLSAISQTEAQKLLHLEQILAERVIGQTEAIQAIARALRRAREDIRDTTRPIASLLFLGPTGVGKTETAKAIAAVYFGNEQAMLRFDMSEYDTPDSLTKLIGAAGEQGHLTEAVRRTPFGIVLLDELEKAHSDVLNVFLQVMEDGRLTDGTGRTIDFSNTMIIATSNAGTDTIQQRYDQGATTQAIEQELLSGDLLRHYFRPEFLNRFDHIAVFTPFTPEELVQVGELMLQQLAHQLQAKGITLQWTPVAVIDLVQRGYNRQFGARPLRRLIQDTVQDGIAKLLLDKQLSRRDSVELQPGGEVTVIKAEPI